MLSLFDVSYTNSSYLACLGVWYAYGRTDIKTLALAAYKAGRFSSSRLAHIPGWDAVVEPMIISQFARIFVLMHHFIQGMTSDNTNVVEVTRGMDAMKRSILDELGGENPLKPQDTTEGRGGEEK